jgi:hypothetical protein
MAGTLLDHPEAGRRIAWLAVSGRIPDGTLFATARRDQTIQARTVASRRWHCTLRVAGPLFKIAKRPAGSSIRAAGGAGTYPLYYLP